MDLQFSLSNSEFIGSFCKSGNLHVYSLRCRGAIVKGGWQGLLRGSTIPWGIDRHVKYVDVMEGASGHIISGLW
eukprot:2515724-Amphidinium_carterae.1